MNDSVIDFVDINAGILRAYFRNAQIIMIDDSTSVFFCGSDKVLISGGRKAPEAIIHAPANSAAFRPTEAANPLEYDSFVLVLMVSAFAAVRLGRGF